MDNDDESPSTPTPNHFLLSTYKENLSVNMSETKINENLKIYKCSLCRKILDNPILTCAKCVNAGQFCSSKHEACSNKRREMFLNMLNKTDYDEFEQYSSNKSMYIQCYEGMFFLKKFNLEKTILQSEFQTKSKSSIETRQMLEDIPIRQKRLKHVNHSNQNLREQIERKKQINIEIQQRVDDTRSRIVNIKDKLNKINPILQSSNGGIRKMIDARTKQEKKLDDIRQERFNELYKYLFPIRRISGTEDVLAARIKDLLIAQKTIVDEINDEQVETDDVSLVADYRYKIVKSCIPGNGDYQVNNLVLTCDADVATGDSDSPQLSPARDSYEVLSGLSHACQLINIIAFYLQIHLPFRLHQLEFSTENLTVDCLRADIAKLNANIISSCISQGIPIKFADVTYTLENLVKLLTLERYPSRPNPVIYSQKYIDMIEKEVNEISRAFITDYWFDDGDDDEKDTIDLLNNSEWEAIPQNEYIPDDSSIYEHSDSSPSTSAQQRSSIMSRSFGYFKSALGYN